MRKAVLDFRLWCATRAETRRRARKLRWAHGELARAEIQIEAIERHRWRAVVPDSKIEAMARALYRKDRAVMVLNELETGYPQRPRPISHWRERASDMLLSH
ncbi:MAG: hypothetical protein AAFY19_00800 [Pseudomonadota bacterium]